MMADEGEEPPSNLLSNERAVVRQTGREAIQEFLAQHSIYQALRDSGKMVFFDINIPIQLAFYALLEHDMAAAPLWDPEQRVFVGLLSVTDFIDILRHYHRRGIAMDDLSARSIGQVMSDGEGRSLQHDHFKSMTAEQPIFEACMFLKDSGHRFVPVVAPEENRVLTLLSHRDVVRFLISNFREQRRLFEDSISELGIGTHGPDVLTVPRSASLTDALDAMETRDVSAVPVVNEANVVVGLYSRSDITFLATATDAESVLLNLQMTLQQVLELRQPDASRSAELLTCSSGASLQSIFERFAESGVHRLVCVDPEGHCQGIVTAKDLVSYFTKA